MRRRDVNEPCLRRDVRDHDALLIHRDRDDVGTAGLGQPAKPAVAGILHRDDVAGRDARSRQEIESLLGSRGHHELAKARRDPAGASDPPCQNQSQVWQTGRVAVDRAMPIDRPPGTSLPLGRREQPRIGSPRTEIENCILGLVTSRRTEEGPGRGIGRNEDGQLGDDGAPTAPPFQKPLGGEVAVRGSNRGPRDTERLCELPTGWQPIARCEPSFENPTPNLLIDLRAQTCAGVLIDEDVHCKTLV